MYLKDIHVELEGILMKATEPSLELRYQHAGEFLRDLIRFEENLRMEEFYSGVAEKEEDGRLQGGGVKKESLKSKRDSIESMPAMPSPQP